jgi:hypothetical protein
VPKDPAKDASEKRDDRASDGRVEQGAIHARARGPDSRVLAGANFTSARRNY